MIGMVIPAAKKTQTELMKIIRASTCGAKLDASGGYNGNCDCTILMRSLKLGVGRTDLAAPGNPNAPNNRENGQNAAEADDSEYGSAVSGARGIVVITEQQDVIDRRADLSCRGVDQSEAHVTAGVFDAVEVAGDAAVRGKEQHAAGVSKEIVFGIERETEVRRLSRSFNGFL